MDLPLTPKAPNIKKKFISPCTSTPYRSPLLEQSGARTSRNESLEDLKANIKELWEKNESVKQRIRCLEEKGYKEEQLKEHIEKIHQYNKIKDIAQMVMGKLAVLDQTTVRKVHEEFGMSEDD